VVENDRSMLVGKQSSSLNVYERQTNVENEDDEMVKEENQQMLVAQLSPESSTSGKVEDENAGSCGLPSSFFLSSPFFQGKNVISFHCFCRRLFECSYNVSI